MKSDRLEIFVDGAFVVAVDSGFAPDRGEIVNFRGANHKVMGRTFTVDGIDRPQVATVSCIINVVPEPSDQEQRA